MHNTGCLRLVHWDHPEGWYWEGGGRREEDSGCGTRVYLWWIHVDIWQNQYNIVKLKKKKKTFMDGMEGLRTSVREAPEDVVEIEEN